MYSQINDTKTYKNVHFSSFGIWLDLRSVGDLYFFAHGAHESVGLMYGKFFFSLNTKSYLETAL